jgi:queuine tRNA-ribosyltransferase
MLFTWKGIINIRNERWKEDFSALDENGVSLVDKYYSKAYLRHLNISGEMLAAQIATRHNLAFYLELVRESRRKIQEGNFTEWKNKMVPQLKVRL